MSLRDEIAYEIYKKDRATSATMSFEDFVSNQSLFIIGLRLVADVILALPAMKEMMEKARALDIIEYGFPQEVESALESARNEMKYA